ncbi:MAG: SDR family oxidoreductase [bacterium]|nr:SDR family oxidoreductase [bacterium]
MEYKKRLLITGVSGLLGNNLARYFRDAYEVFGTYLEHPVIIEDVTTSRCDVAIQSDVQNIIEKYRPQVVIHCVALTNLDRCEEDTALCDRLNHLSAKNTVEALDTNVKLVYISTDGVYDGIKGDFTESDPIAPQNYYGRSKYSGELEALRAKGALILRTNFFGWNVQDKDSLGEWIIKSLAAGKIIDGFVDAIFSSLYTLDFAGVIDLALKRDLGGIYNCGAHRPISKFSFAQEVAKVFGFDSALIQSRSILDYPFKAKRGVNLSMNVEKLEQALGILMPTIEESVRHFYEDYQKGLPAAIKNHE